MTAELAGAEVPEVGADKVTMGRFAHLLGTQMPTWDAAAARAVAAALARAHASRDDQHASDVLFALLLAVRGVADKLESIDATNALSAHEPAKLRALQFARFSKNVRPVTVATELKITPQYASNLLRSMVKEGLLLNLGRAQTGDGRASVYGLTPWGQETLDRARRAGKVEGSVDDEAIRTNQVEMLRDDLVIEQEARRAGGADTEAARERLETLARHARDLGEANLEVDILSELSTVLRQSGRADDARVLVNERFDGAAFATDRGVLRRCYENAKLEMLAPKPDFDKVRLLLDRSRSLATDDDPLKVWIDLTDSERARLQGNFVASLNRASRAYLQARDTEHTFSQIKAGVQIALIARTAGLPSQRPLLERLVETAGDSGYGVLAAECQLQLGELYRVLGHPAEAHALLSAAEEQLGAQSCGRAAAFASSALAALAYEHPQAAAGTEHIDVREKLLFALAVANRVGAADAKALTLRRLAILAADHGRRDEAEDYLRQSLDLYAHSNRSSIVGQLECQTNLVTLAPTRAAVDTSVNLLDELVERASTVIDEPETPASIVEPYVFRHLVKCAEAAERPEAVARIRAQRLKLREAKLVGARTQVAETAMGREPVLI